MVKIDLTLVKKRTEHHDGPLETLEEIALHQFKIRRIEFLNDNCRNLKILLLQNNKITKIEGLQKLKSLVYLNLAINRITKIENLDKLESLVKLDLTANFIYDKTCIQNLENLHFLDELYLMGNPCLDDENCIPYTVSKLQKITKIDGKDISKTDRILYLQKFKEVENQILNEFIPLRPLPDYILESEGSDYEENDAGTRLKRAANQTAEENVGIDKNTPKREKGQTNEKGEIMQWNESKIQIEVEEKWKEQELLVLVHLPIHLSNEYVDIDVNESFVYGAVKERSFQVRLAKKVQFGKVKAFRITTTGVLKLHCPICEGESIEKPYQYRFQEEDVDQKGNDEGLISFGDSRSKNQGKFKEGQGIQSKADDLKLEFEGSIPDDLPDLM